MSDTQDQETPTYTAEQMIAIGGKEWRGKHGTPYRIYFRDVRRQLMGLDIKWRGTGSIESVYLDGESLSNSEGRRLGGWSVYWDADDGRIHIDDGLNPSYYGEELTRRIHASIAAKVAALPSKD